ncbi:MULTISPECIES: hypothetical protein [unclassified Streptomyces]|uniref:hypothetical protein n=1 Tax=unclassified Streptomyces TaxID=2593676 RepID=UPI000DC761D7|nr:MULTISPECIES: hypothetical protein [unclassified Streptomyces]AWZ06880.1 hypothetical protein DRB89_22195 [Streptomyces sp. ICC4]AWZ14541.1 hypothetical protein DRB96_22335 [Streptomyces sp. ICC1]
MFKAGDEVRIVSCEDDSRAVGRTGRIVDETPPGPLTGGRWTVDRIGILIGPVLCHGYELEKAGS